MHAVVSLLETAPSGPVVLACSGEIDLANNELLWMCSLATADRNPAWVVVDLTEVTFIDCASLRLLDELRERLNPSTRWTVVCPPGPLQRVLTLAGFTDDHPVVATMPAYDHRGGGAAGATVLVSGGAVAPG